MNRQKYTLGFEREEKNFLSLGLSVSFIAGRTAPVVHLEILKRITLVTVCAYIADFVERTNTLIDIIER